MKEKKSNITEKNNCQNCSNYVAHYAIIGFRLLKTNSGHCKKNLRKIPTVCKNWSNCQIDNAAEKEAGLNDTLAKILKRINQLVLILGKND